MLYVYTEHNLFFLVYCIPLHGETKNKCC